jgi:hypothetical protein
MIRRSLLALVVAAGVGLPAPALAAAPATRLVLAVAAENGWAHGVLLRCAPPGGAHPAPAHACAILRTVDGDPAALRPRPGGCTLEYAPVTAHLDGIWRGRAVTWSRSYSNLCALHRATGRLFRF